MQPTMNFFQYQEAARRRTGSLVVFFCLAVTLIILAVYLLCVGAWFVATEGRGSHSGESGMAWMWNPRVFLAVVGVTLTIVILGSLYKIAALSKGGAALAEGLGGVPISQDTHDLDERKVLNVVEEMAIASGTPVPRVFALNDEEGINAFAAGFTSADAVIAVTRGCMTQLTRDELQGVIAHEFSHILNGDMRLNLRLAGVIFGILVISLVGYGTMRGGGVVSDSSDGKGVSFGLLLLLLGALLMVIGYIGVIFGRLIKACVSRQREFLADASAAQFTRNPGGLAGALKKIGGCVAGSRVQHDHAEEASHLFFANGLRQPFFGLMSTHPPLIARIHRLDPSFEGRFEEAAPAPPAAEEPAVAAAVAPEAPARRRVQPQAVVESVGRPGPEHLAHGAAMVAAIPAELRLAIRKPAVARAVTYGLLLSGEAAVRQTQLQWLQQHAEPGVNQTTQKLLPVLDLLAPALRLPVADMAISALKDMPGDGYEAFRRDVDALAGADQRIDLFEYALQRMIVRRLDPVFRKVKPVAVQYYSLKPLLPMCADLLSCLAYSGTRDVAAAQTAFALAAARLPDGAGLTLRPLEQCGIATVGHALDQLAAAAPRLKKSILDACVTCVLADREVTVSEAQLLRAVADSLDCPIPPIMADPGSHA